jgi:hypothetical protein
VQNLEWHTTELRLRGLQGSLDKQQWLL